MILLTTGLMGCESLFVSCLDTGIGVYNGLFHSTAITHSFDQFVHIIGAIILLFFPFTEGSTDLTSILLSVIPAHAVTPIVVYSNADTQKFEIIKENKGKSGIYRWTNLENGSTYIGSASGLRPLDFIYIIILII